MAHAPEPPAARRLRRLALTALVMNVVIVITGGTVRITGSGLGCPTWPSCDGTRLVPRPGGEHTTWQTAIEFGNRLLTFAVLAAVVAVLWQLRRTRPHPPLLERLAWGLIIGVLAQALLGGITVLTGLSPYTVAAHFLLSMVLISLATILHERVRPSAGHPPASSGIRHATTVLAIVGFAVLVLGTIVTGAGPHGGDITAPRFDVDIRLIAIAHADAVWLLVGLTIAMVAVTWRSGPPRLRQALRALLAIEIAQGIVGYTQYALGVPRLLVTIHVAGAAVLWVVVSAVWIRARPDIAVMADASRSSDATSDEAGPAQPDGSEVASPR